MPVNKVNTKRKQIRLDTGLSEGIFKDLKKCVTQPPILEYPAVDTSFILDTDASSQGLGAVLSQMQECQERVIAYASKTLSKSQKRYCTIYR